MDSEFYVVNLVRTDAEARGIVAGHIGLPASLTNEQVLGQLVQREALLDAMSWLNCDEARVFVELRRRLDQAQCARHPEPVDTLDEEDLRWLLGDPGRVIVGELLNCPPSVSLQSLFNNHLLAQSLIWATVLARSEASGMDSEELLYKLLEPASRPKLTAWSGTSDPWEWLITVLRQEAEQKLAGEFACREGDVLRYLIASIKMPQTGDRATVPSEDFGEGRVLDFIGLSKLRVLMRRFEYSLLQQATSDADLGKARLPACRVPLLLPALIRFYAGREFKAALEALLSTVEPLRRMGGHPEPSPGAAASQDDRLEAVIERDEYGTDEVAVVIRCSPEPGGSPVEILRLLRCSSDNAEHIKQHLPATVGQLSRAGETLPDRVLNTLLPLASPALRTLREAIGAADDPEAVDDAFVQCFLLSGASLSATTVAPQLELKGDINTGTPPSARVEFPQSAQDIAARLREDYAREGKRLRPIESNQ